MRYSYVYNKLTHFDLIPKGITSLFKLSVARGEQTTGQ